MSKVYTSDKNLREGRPRSERLRRLGSGVQTGVSPIAGSKAAVVSHSHGNKDDLDRLFVDGQYVQVLVDQAEESGTTIKQKVKAYAGFADNAKQWDGKDAVDYLDQPVKTSSSVSFAALMVSGQRIYFGDVDHYIEIDVDGNFHFSHNVWSEGNLSAGGLSSGGGGGGGSIVSWNQLATAGTKIATISIDGVSTDVYAPATATWENISGKPSWIGNDKPSYAFSEITGTASAAQIPSLDWSKIATGKPTTLSGYGITDAKIVNGVITLGTNTITPLTSHQSLAGLGASLGAASNALTLKNQSGTVLSTISAANLVTVLGNTAVNRAIADGDGTMISPAINTWRDNLGSPSLFEAAVIPTEFVNQLEFIPFANLIYEYSEDNGVTWHTDTGVTENIHKAFWGGTFTASYNIPKTRAWRFTVTSYSYCYLNMLYMYTSGSGGAFDVTLERHSRYNGTDVWTTVTSQSMVTLGWPGHNVIKHGTIPFSTGDSSSYFDKVRLTIKLREDHSPTYTTYTIYKIAHYGGYPYKSPLIYSVDGNKNVTFPSHVAVGASISASTIVKVGGTSSQFLKADGSVDGNAYLPITGGAVSGVLTLRSGFDTKLVFNNTDGEKYQIISFRENDSEYAKIVAASDGVRIEGQGNINYNGHLLYHSGNLTASVIGGLGTLSNNISGNAASATKLATARNIWGQSFDGTAAISGDMSSVGKITFTAKTSKSTSGNVLEVVTINGINYLHTTLPFFSDEAVSAGGIGTGGGGGTDVSWTNGDANYGVLTIAGNAHNVSILGHTHPQYMLASAKGAANGVAELGADSKIPLTQLPDIVMGQLMYGGTVNASNVATLSANVKTKLGISSSTVTLTNDTGTYGYTKFEGVYFIMSADSSFASLDLKVGDWLISTGTAWKKIDNTDAVTGVKGQNQTTYQVGNVNISWDNVKPSAGVAKTELASGVQTSLDLADGALQKERFNVLSKQSGSSLATCDDLIGTCGIFRMGSKAQSETPDAGGYGNMLSMFIPSVDTYAQIYLGYYNDSSRNIFFRTGSTTSTASAHRTWHHVLHDGNFVAGTDYLTPSGTAANASKLENHSASYFAGVSLGNVFTSDNYFGSKIILGDSGSSPYLVGGDAEPLTIHGINGITIENDNTGDYGLSVNTPAYFDSTILVADEVTAMGFKVGTQTGFLKANGTVDNNTYLTAHQTIYAATFSAGTFSAKTYTPNSAAQTINIPTTTSHISEGSNLYFTDARAVSACSGTYAKLAAANTFTAANTFSGAVSVQSLTITETTGGAGIKHLAFSRSGYNYITVPSGQSLSIGYDATTAETIMVVSSASVAPGASGTYKSTTTLGTATTPWQAVYGKTYYADCTSGATVMNAKLQNGTTYSIMGASSSTPSGWTGWTTPGVLLGTVTADTELTLRSGGTINVNANSSAGLTIRRLDSTTSGCYIRFANSASTNPYIGYFGVYKSGTTVQYRWYKYSTPTDGSSQSVTTIARLDTDGNFVANGQVTAGAASDLRFKKNIESMSRENAESILAGLRPVEFDWNDLGTSLSGNKGHDTGLIAQETLSVFPYAVSPIYEKYLRIDYAKLTPILVAGWQSHEMRIAKLERENEMLREQIKRLRA